MSDTTVKACPWNGTGAHNFLRTGVTARGSSFRCACGAKKAVPDRELRKAFAAGNEYYGQNRATVEIDGDRYYL
jgi:hypothetical protein